MKQHPFLLCAWVLFYSINGLSDRTTDVLNSKENSIRRLTEYAAELFDKRVLSVENCLCSIHTCSFELDSKTCHEGLGTPAVCGDCKGQNLDYTSTVVNTPPGADPLELSDELKASICTYQGLESKFKELYAKDSLWAYLGTTDGHFRMFPAVGREHNHTERKELHGCRQYDPRGRPWYVAASTGPKDIVFIIDKSNSMLDPNHGRPLKWKTTTEAVMAMIDTLATTDYFNIVVFSDGAEQLWTQNNLARGTAENKGSIKEYLEAQVPKGGTNFDAAFELAFSLLTNACSAEEMTCSNCEKVIIFLTDGKDTSRSPDGGIKPSEMAVKIAGYQDKLFEMTSRRASIFTFSMGSDADDSIPRQIACNNDGSWSFIKDTDDPLTAMRSYYLFLAARRAYRGPIWSEPYVDDFGLGKITTVAAPVYARSSNNEVEVFLGVVGNDVFLSELAETSSDVSDILNDLVNRSSKCNPSEITDCQLQVLRNIHADAATCIDRFPIKSAPPSEEDKPQCFTNSRSFYKRYSSLVDWDEARDRCVEDGGALVSIGSKEELAFVANMASDDGSWIGARRQFDAFVWLDTSSPDLEYTSEAWGIGQPERQPGEQDCVSIDTRGPSGNLNDASCEDALSFICEYNTNASCEGQILNPREQPKQYFDVPPIDLCVHEEEALARVRPTRMAADKASSDIVCPFGNPKPDFDIQCCADCRRTGGLSPLLTAIVLLALICGMVFSVSILYRVCKKSSPVKDSKVELSPIVSETDSHNQPHSQYITTWRSSNSDSTSTTASTSSTSTPKQEN